MAWHRRRLASLVSNAAKRIKPKYVRAHLGQVGPDLDFLDSLPDDLPRNLHERYVGRAWANVHAFVSWERATGLRIWPWSMPGCEEAVGAAPACMLADFS
jgi:hypothetical protein